MRSKKPPAFPPPATPTPRTDLEVLKISEETLGENVTWLFDSFWDHAVRANDVETMNRLNRISDTWKLLARQIGKR